MLTKSLKPGIRIANELQIEEKTQRTCGRQTKRTNISSSSLSEYMYFKLAVAIPFLFYHLSQELNDIFQKDDHVAYAAGYIIPQKMVNLSESDIQKLSSDLYFSAEEIRCVFDDI